MPAASSSSVLDSASASASVSAPKPVLSQKEVMATSGPSSSSSSSSQGKQSKGKFSMSRPAGGSFEGGKGKKRGFETTTTTTRAAKDSDSDADSNSEADTDTDEEISAAKERGRSSKTVKRKRRAVSPGTFGSALDAFLGGDGGEDGKGSAQSDEEEADEEEAESSRPTKAKKVPTTSSTQTPIFSLAPSVRSRISSSQLTAKAARIATEERKRREERFRVKDLIGGWGRPGEIPGASEHSTIAAGKLDGQDSDAEDDLVGDEWMREGGSKGYERRLRKVAQRGVVKLFNAIRAAQSTTSEDVEEKHKTVVSSATTLATQSAPASKGAKNALGGKGQELADLSKTSFLSLLRAGGKSAI